ncbi:MAG TPA: hypothetical protein VFT95_01715 [Micromonosporaceae bacterium]|nr:hypothetical protein [Micromonosporaceae bacterium]
MSSKAEQTTAALPGQQHVLPRRLDVTDPASVARSPPTWTAATAASTSS